MERIKIGQIGISHEHAAGKMNALRQLSDVYEVVGVVDDRASAAAKRPVNDLSMYQDLPWLTEEELFAIPGLQAVTIETPNTDLVPAALRCMEHRLAIHMDKPGGEDLTVFTALIHGCRDRELPFQMGYMFRSNPAMQWCIAAVRKGWLGDIFEIRAGMNHDYGDNEYEQYIGEFKGGLMFNLGCHLIDFVIALMGRPENVTPFLTSAPGYDRRLKNNCLSVLEYSHTAAVLHVCSKEVNGLARRSLKVCGTQGTFELSPLERFDGSPLTAQVTLAEDKDELPAGEHTIECGIRTDRYTDQLMKFARIIRGKIPNPYSYEHDLMVQETVLAASGYIDWRKP